MTSSASRRLGRGMAFFALTSASSYVMADFVNDSHLNLKTQNFYFRNDYRDGAGQNQRGEWAQGFTADFSSGFTEGDIGFGVDAVANLGLKLDSSPDRSGSGLLPQGSATDPRRSYSRRAADEYSKLDVTGKVRFYKDTLLQVGTVDARLGVLQPNISRLFPQTFQGAWLTHRFTPDFKLGIGQLRRVRYRDSSDYEPMRINTQGGQYVADEQDRLNLLSLDYKVSKNLSFSYNLAQLEDVYRQHYLGSVFSIPAGPGSIIGDMRVFRSEEDGGATAGNVDNTALSGQLGYRWNGSTLRVGYQKMLGDTAFTYIDGTATYLFTESLVANLSKQDERVWMLRYDQDFAALGVPGLEMSVKYVNADQATVHNFNGEGREWECDYDLAYTVQSGTLKDLSFRWRHGIYHSNYTRNSEQDRLIVSYAFNAF